MPNLIRRAHDPASGSTVPLILIGEEKPSGSVAGPAPAAPAAPAAWPLAGSALVGAAIALGLGWYGRVHDATGLAVAPLRPDQLLAFKSALASVAAGLALFQLLSALWLYGRLGTGPAPRWVGPAHRWSGTVAFVASLPAAYHCLWGLGFQTTTTRVLVHSVLGCAFYGAFGAKLLLLRSNRLPGWAIPLVGSTLVTLLVGLWFSSAWWYYRL